MHTFKNILSHTSTPLKYRLAFVTSQRNHVRIRYSRKVLAVNCVGYHCNLTFFARGVFFPFFFQHVLLLLLTRRSASGDNGSQQCRFVCMYNILQEKDNTGLKQTLSFISSSLSRSRIIITLNSSC